MGKSGRGVRRVALGAACIVAAMLTLFLASGGDGAWGVLGGVAFERPEPDLRHEADLLRPHAGERARGGARLAGRVPPDAARPEVDRATWWLGRGSWESSLRGLKAMRAARPERTAAELIDEAFEDARGPVVRQNLIFQMALCVDPGTSMPWLARVARGEGADGDDASCALAFLGDVEGGMDFAARAREPLVEHGDITRQHHHHDVGNRNDELAREQLRPYRAIETLLRRTYFDYERHVGSVLFVPGVRLEPAALIDLLRSWMERYPDHPGTDDVCLYIARAHLYLGDLKEAARWYARTCSAGDADAAVDGLRGYITCAELFLGEHELFDVLRGVEGGERLEDLTEYIRIRRAAQRGDVETALADVQVHAARQPDGLFGVAWRQRYTTSVPRAFDSGLEPLPEDDDLRTVETPWDPIADAGTRREAAYRVSVRTYALGQPQGREAGQPVLLPELDRFAHQLRLWEALAELQRRERGARREARADLAYKIAALYYHDPLVVFPAYAPRGSWFPSLLGREAVAPFLRHPSVWAAAYEPFARDVAGEWRAAQAFDELASAWRATRIGELASFSRGQALRRFVRLGQAPPAVRKAAADAIVPAFESFLRDYRDSTMADDAEQAIRFWRGMAPSVRGGSSER